MQRFFDSIYRVGNEARAALQEIIRERTYSKNEIIQEIGSRCRTVYMVKSGAARIFYYKEGNDITEHFAFENEVIVRAESLFTGKPTAKGIQAIDDTVMVVIDSVKLFQLYDEYHDLERLFRLIFEREYVNTLKRIENFQFKSARERYLELVDSPNLIQKVPLKYIASYLGITQVSLSRIRSSLQD
ncbi:cAMP-binding domain of CRP or a regulatory subunit of cAMP-dependent protein kinases [Cyclobacterium lianum]|uniref:cAMP-binding domain of CRP or a regulatory subunit of cAMP-dependent protein kinases n=1 Tax=Cyclobacterium lianum TaxID=388280 RepID=A0A1M7HVV8_9BACT|nr:Crp/Fnr family transcriptional regulator [Cyclobacterium lianum]SHM32548.1 cAMP-binding domain of CRP or a regulatory subunit of cAMP-dependent protein kinases [Cyclobacterium lianum]